MRGLHAWAEQRLRYIETVIHHPEPQLPDPRFDPKTGLRIQAWDYTWTARCPRCEQDAVWQRKPTEPAARIHCPCQ